MKFSISIALAALLIAAVSASSHMPVANRPDILDGDTCATVCSGVYNTSASCNADSDCVWDTFSATCAIKCALLQNADLCNNFVVPTSQVTPLRVFGSSRRCFWDGSGKTCRERCHHLPLSRCSNDTFCEINSNNLCVHKCSDVNSYSESVLADVNITNFINVTDISNITRRGDSGSDAVRAQICDNVYEGHCYYDFNAHSCKTSCRARHGPNEASCASDNSCRLDNHVRHICRDSCARNNDVLFCGDNRTSHCRWIWSGATSGSCTEDCTQLPSNISMTDCNNYPGCQWHAGRVSSKCQQSCSWWNGNQTGCTRNAYCDYNDQWGVCVPACRNSLTETDCNAVVNSTCLWDVTITRCVRKCDTVVSSDPTRCQRYFSQDNGRCIGIGSSCARQCEVRHFVTGVTSTAACAADTNCALVEGRCYDRCSVLSNVSCDASSYCSRDGTTCHMKCSTDPSLTTEATCTANTNCQWLPLVGCVDGCARHTTRALCEPSSITATSFCEWQHNMTACTTKCSLRSTSTCTTGNSCQLGGNSVCHLSCSLHNEYACGRSPYCLMVNHSYTSKGRCVQNCRFAHGIDSTACAADANCEFLGSAGCAQKCSLFSNANHTETCNKHPHCSWQGGNCVSLCVLKHTTETACAADAECTWGVGRCTQNCARITNMTNCAIMNKFCFASSSTTCASRCELAHATSTDCTADTNCHWAGATLGCRIKCSILGRNACTMDQNCFWHAGSCKQSCDAFSDVTSCNAESACQWFEKLGACQRKCSNLTLSDCMIAMPRCRYHGASATCQPACKQMHSTMASCNADTSCNWHNTTYTHFINSTHNMTIRDLRCEARCSTLENSVCTSEPHCIWLVSASKCLPRNCSDRAVTGCDVGDNTCHVMNGNCEANCEAAHSVHGVCTPSDCTSMVGCGWNYLNRTCGLSCERKYGYYVEGTARTACRADSQCYMDPGPYSNSRRCLDACQYWSRTSCPSHCNGLTFGGVPFCMSAFAASHSQTNSTACGDVTPPSVTYTSPGSSATFCLPDCSVWSYGTNSTAAICSSMGVGSAFKMCRYNQTTKVCSRDCLSNHHTNRTACALDSQCEYIDFSDSGLSGCHTKCSHWNNDPVGCKNSLNCEWDFASKVCRVPCATADKNNLTACSADPRCRYFSEPLVATILSTTLRFHCLRDCSAVPAANCSQFSHCMLAADGTCDNRCELLYSSTSNTAETFNTTFADQLCASDPRCILNHRSSSTRDCEQRCDLYPQSQCTLSQTNRACLFSTSNRKCLSYCFLLSSRGEAYCQQARGCAWLGRYSQCQPDCAQYEGISNCTAQSARCDWNNKTQTCVNSCYNRHNTSYDDVGCVSNQSKNDGCVWVSALNRCDRSCEVSHTSTSFSDRCQQSSHCSYNSVSGKCYTRCQYRSSSNATLCADGGNECGIVNTTSSGSQACRDVCSQLPANNLCAGASSCTYTGISSNEYSATTPTKCSFSCGFNFDSTSCNASSTCEWRYSQCYDRCEYLDSQMCGARSHCHLDRSTNICRSTCAFRHGSSNSTACAADTTCTNFNPYCRESCVGRALYECHLMSHCEWSLALGLCENRCSVVHRNISGRIDDPYAADCVADAACMLRPDGLCTQKCNRYHNTTVYSGYATCTSNPYCTWNTAEGTCKQTCSSRHWSLFTSRQFDAYRTACEAESDCEAANITTYNASASTNRNTYVCLDRCSGFGNRCLDSWTNIQELNPTGRVSGQFCVPYDNEGSCALRCQVKYRDGVSCSADPNCKWYIGKFCLEKCTVFSDQPSCENDPTIRQCTWKRGRCEESCSARFFHTAGTECRALDDTCDSPTIFIPLSAGRSRTACIDSCSVFDTVERCDLRVPDCLWSTTSKTCVKNCGFFIQNATECEGSPDCTWFRSIGTCANSCASFRERTTCNTGNRCIWMNTTGTCETRCSTYSDPYADVAGCDAVPHCQWVGTRTGKVSGKCLTRCESFGRDWVRCLPSGSTYNGVTLQGVNPHCSFINRTQTCRLACRVAHTTMASCSTDRDCSWFFGANSCEEKCSNEVDEAGCIRRGSANCAWDANRMVCRRSCHQTWNNATGCNSDVFCTWSTSAARCIENCSQANDILGYRSCTMDANCAWVSKSSEVVMHFYHPNTMEFNATMIQVVFGRTFNQPYHLFHVATSFTSCGRTAVRVSYRGTYDVAMAWREGIGRASLAQRQFLAVSGIFDLALGEPVNTGAAAISAALAAAVAVVLMLF